MNNRCLAPKLSQWGWCSWKSASSFNRLLPPLLELPIMWFLTVATQVSFLLSHHVRLHVPNSPVTKFILLLRYSHLVTGLYSSLTLNGHGLCLNSVSQSVLLLLIILAKNSILELCHWQPWPYWWLNMLKTFSKSMKLCSRNMSCRIHYF